MKLGSLWGGLRADCWEANGEAEPFVFFMALHWLPTHCDQEIVFSDERSKHEQVLPTLSWSFFYLNTTLDLKPL